MVGEDQDKSKSARRPFLLFWEIVAISLLTLGLLVLLAYGAFVSLKLVAALWMIAGASAAAGGILGFLFGVPRFRSDTDQAKLAARDEHFMPNTNLEQVSDWLTKIIIGASLVNLGELANGLVRISDAAARLLSPASDNAAQVVATGAPVILAAIVYNACVGFIWGYLWSSIRIRRQLQGDE